MKKKSGQSANWRETDRPGSGKSTMTRIMIMTAMIKETITANTKAGTKNKRTKTGRRERRTGTGMMTDGMSNEK
jgi:hypothetical protein